MTRASSKRTIVAVVAAGLVLSACGGGRSRERPSAPAVAVMAVTVSRFSYQPDVVSVTAGTSVEWTNLDQILHTVTSGTPSDPGVPGVAEDVPPRPDGILDLPLDGAGATARYTFNEPGSFTYYCAIHAGMSARVDVRADS